MALAVPVKPHCRLSGSPVLVKVLSRRSAKPRAMKSCSPRERFCSSAGGPKAKFPLANALGGNFKG